MHYTGVSNQKIKDNIRYLLETSNREKVIIRTPMIPEMTATKDNIKGIAKYLNGIYQYVSYEILNYNPLAEAKYHLVDREYCFEENEKAEKITEEILKENPDLKAIYMTSHGELGVCMALKKNGMAGKIKMIANDFMGENYRLMREGYIHFLIGQDASIQGYEPVMILFRLLFHAEEPEKELIYTEIYIRNEYTIPE